MKTLKKIFSMIILLSMLAACIVSPAYAAEGKTLKGTEIKKSDNNYSWLSPSTENYIYDFTDKEILTYANDEKLSTKSLRTNMVFDGEKLSCKPGKSFIFGSKIFLGDDYGLYGGELSFDAVLANTLSVGVRLSKAGADNIARGIWFVFKDGKIYFNEPESGTNVAFALTYDSQKHNIKITDRSEKTELYFDDTLVCTITYADYGCFAVYEANQKEAACAVDSSKIQASGYFSFCVDDFEGGYLDNIAFSHINVSVIPAVGDSSHSVNYSNWIATDDRDRTTPSADSFTEVKNNKQVGVFYFVAQCGTSSDTILDNTMLYLTLGLDGAKKHYNDVANSGGYYWAEPYFGYYTSTDEWVYRKHAYMLEAAGVDFIFLDVTNGVTYNENVEALFDTWLQIRHEGNSTPDICFTTNPTESLTHNSLDSLSKSVLSEENFEKYRELFYEYQGKPLMLGATLSPGDAYYELQQKFTVRKCWAWQDSNGTWSWLQEYKKNGNGYSYINGGPGRDLQGNFEQLALCVGHHPTTSKGRSYANTVFPQVGNDFGYSLDSGAGIGFASQFEAVKYFNPDILLITGWNEWTAGLNHGVGSDNFAGQGKVDYYFVDQFNTEYSRDAEPMKLREGNETGVGFGDNYYYQMSSYIREFKGLDKAEKADGQKSIDMSDISSWDSVTPKYCDTLNDNALRSVNGFFNGITYVNNSGRNDIEYAKISQDSEYLYFLVKCVNNIIVDDGSEWMNLFLNTDCDSKTGWEGYDFVINRSRGSNYVSIESLDNSWGGKHVGQALYSVDGEYMQIRVKKSVLGLSDNVSELYFKWADNSTGSGNVMEFMDLGDTFPNDRYACIYIGEQTAQTVDYSYNLLSYDGSSVELRDESAPLPRDERNSISGAENDEKESETITEESTEQNSETLPETNSENASSNEETVSKEEHENEKTGCKSIAFSLPISVIASIATLSLCTKKKRHFHKD